MIDEVRDFRPATRGECENGPRPCPWVGCRYHLLLEIAPRVFTRPPGEWQEKVSDDQFLELLENLEYSCLLDLVVDGGLTLEECGAIYHVTRERIRQIQSKALQRLTRRVASMGMGRELLVALEELAGREHRSLPRTGFAPWMRW